MDGLILTLWAMWLLSGVVHFLVYTIETENFPGGVIFIYLLFGPWGGRLNDEE